MTLTTIRRPGGALALAALLVALGLAATTQPADAAPAPGWAAQSSALPSNFSNADHVGCEEFGDCDRYLVTVTNVGTKPSSGTTVVTDTLPTGVTVHEVDRAIEREPGLAGAVNQMECTEGETPGSTVLRCQYEGAVPPGSVLAISLNVDVEAGPAHEVTNRVEVHGGGAASVTSSEPSTSLNGINASTPGFGPRDFSIGVYGTDGVSDTLAGDHPGAVTTTINYPTEANSNLGFQTTSQFYRPVEEPKDELVSLPLGFVGDPLAATECPESALFGSEENPSKCPSTSRVGVVGINLEGKTQLRDIFNVVPEAGYPAEFGFEFNEAIILMRARLLPSASGYVLSVSVPTVPRSQLVKVSGVRLTFFGDPVEQNIESEGFIPNAFFRNPTDCAAGPLKARLEINSWVKPTHWVAAETTAYEANATHAVTGCEQLQWNPTVSLASEQTQADTPSGYEVDLKVPQNPNAAPALGVPDLKDAVVTLPSGVSVSPSAADGLQACHAIGPQGINITHGWTPTGEQPLDPEVPEAMEIGPDGLPHIAPGHCPSSSQIGTVEIRTPVLRNPLHGHVYVADPLCGGSGQPACTDAEAEAGKLFRLYIEAQGSGAVVKLEGRATVNTTTGQVTTRFEENPQLPFEELKLVLNGGPRAPLATPQACGTATMTSSLTPWSAPGSGPPATPSSSYSVTGCQSPQPFGPSFLGQTSAAGAGAFSPFTLTLGRRDGERSLAGVDVNMPLGLLGMLSNVNPCTEPQASSGACGVDSLLGHAKVAAGAGSHPFWTEGPVYLTGPYHGAPFGLSIVIPTAAGPFRLAGNNSQGGEVVRSTITVDPHTAAVSVDSDPFPQIVDGVPVRVQQVVVTIDRPEFIFNPTNCAQQSVSGSVAGLATDGSLGSAPVATPFAAAGCARLAFSPKFAVSTQAKFSKANGTSLDVKVTSSRNQANIARVRVTLPKQLPSRLATLQKACVDTVFNANPAACPSGSLVGTARAVTPVLKASLVGPAYLVSHGNAAFPDLVVVLQGEGITLYLDGNTNIKNGVTSSTFNAVPDAPVSTFELKLPAGPHSVLTGYLPAGAKNSMCGQVLAMPTTFVGQNGAALNQNTPISVTGCGQSISISKRKLTGNSISVTVSTSAKGLVSIRGAGLRTTSKTLGAGSHILTVSLTANGQTARKLGRKISIHASLKVGKKTVSKTASLKL